MVKILLDINGLSWYLSLKWNINEIPAIGDIIIVDKSFLSLNDQLKLRRIPSNQTFKWADEEDTTSALENFDFNTEMLVTGRLWKYAEDEDTKCLLAVKFVGLE